MLLQIEILDRDDFLGRASGSRGHAEESRKDTALANYLKMMDKEVFCVFHSNFSEKPDLPLFALKILSRFLGPSPIQANANKVMLLERNAAQRIFGVSPGFNCSRAGYFLCYASYLLANKEKDMKQLGGYSRKKYLRYRGDMPEEAVVKRIKK